MEILSELVWKFVFFDHLDLFRISSFEFRVFYLLLIPWRLCVFPSTWLRAVSLSNRAGVISFPIPNFCCSLVSGKLSDNETLCQPEPRLEVELDICLQPGLLAIVSPQFRPG